MRLFKVRLSMKDGSMSIFNVLGKDDQEARNKAVALIKDGWDELGNIREFPGVDYAEIEFLCHVQGSDGTDTGIS